MSGYQQSEQQSELDGLETVVRNVIPILNSPILALLAVPVSHLKEEKKKITKEQMIQTNMSQFDELLSESDETERTDEITNIEKRKSKECCRSIDTTKTNDYKRETISDNSDLATIIEIKDEQDFVVKHEDEREKEKVGSDILSEVEVIEEIESITSISKKDNGKLQDEKIEVENGLTKMENKTLQKCNIM